MCGCSRSAYYVDLSRFGGERGLKRCGYCYARYDGVLVEFRREEERVQNTALRVVDAEVEADVERLRARGMERASLEGEIRTLREALALVAGNMKSEEDTAKMGAVVSRLCDTIVRALLAQQKLSAQDEGFTWLRGHFDRMLRELGYGEDSQF
jgi:hypothetical protein